MSGGVLSQVYLFRAWPSTTLARLERASRAETHRADAMLFLEGEPCRHLNVIVRGRVQMVRLTPGGDEVTLAVLTEGALVGAAALFLGVPYPASARVVSREAEIVRVPGEPLLAVLREQPDCALRLMAGMAERLAALTDRLYSLRTESSLERLAGWLLDQPSSPDAQGRRTIRLEGSKRKLAHALGMTPETLSRALRRLSERGWIAVEGKRIAVLDARALGGVSPPCAAGDAP